jgi:hypothetical protein
MIAGAIEAVASAAAIPGVADLAVIPRIGAHALTEENRAKQQEDCST